MRYLCLFPLLLAACSREAEAPANPSASPEPTATVTAPAPAATPITAMPAAMRGRWGMTANDCDTARSDNKGLMVVEADRLEFYESRGMLRQASAAGSREVRATFAYSGEGMAWEAEDTFRLTQDGSVLVRRSTGAEPTEPLEYRRCP